MQTFDNIILTSRPGSGKSEFIDFLKGVPPKDRVEKFHIGAFQEIDDHPWVWELGESDDRWENLGRKRLWTRNVGCGYVTLEPELVLTKFMTLKMNRELLKNFESSGAGFYEEKTLFIEFGRGGKGAYEWTFNHFDEKILKHTVIFFINNSFEECIRRNDARYDEKKKHSILAHKVPDEEMNGIYRTHDLAELTGNKPFGYLNIKGIKIPFVTVVNEPEVTEPKLIEERFSPPLMKLWELLRLS